MKRIPQEPEILSAVTHKRIAVSEAPSAATGRNFMIERLRIVMMFEVVAYHTFGRLPLLGGLGLPIFLILSIAFSISSAEKHGMREVAVRRFHRIGVPWLFWWGVYAVFFTLIAVRREAPIGDVFRPLMILYGPSLHLWFCPFIILAGLVAVFLHRCYGGKTSFLKAGLTLSIALACLAVMSSETIIESYGLRDLPEPFWQWYFSGPSLALGLATGQILLLSRNEPRWMNAFALCSSLIGGASIAFLGAEHLFRRYAVSLAVIVAAFAIGRRAGARDRFTSCASPLMLGIYLIHIIFVYLLFRPLHENDLLHTAAAFVSSLVAVALMQRTRFRRFV